MKLNQQPPKSAASSARPDRALILFFLLSFVIAWGMIPLLGAIAQRAGLDDWLALSAMGEALDFGSVQLPVPGWVIYLITRVQDFAFSISGVIMIALLHGTAGLRQLGGRLLRWRIGWRVWLAAMIPFGLYGLATAISGKAGSFTFSGGTLSTILFSAEAGFLVTLLLRGPMGEELGLRGFALPRLQSTMSPLKASMVIGLFWALWHLPVLLGRDLLSVIVFLLVAFLLSFVFTALFNGSGGSLLPVLLFHAAQNLEEIFETLFPGLLGTDWELISTVGLLLVGIGAAVWLRRQPEVQPASE